MSRDLKEMILGALDQVGGQDYLAKQAIKNPQCFIMLVGRVLPMTVNMQGPGLLEQIATAAMAMRDAARAQPQIIDGTATQVQVEPTELGGEYPPYQEDELTKSARVLIAAIIVAKMWFISDRWYIADDLPGRQTMSAYGFSIGLGSSLIARHRRHIEMELGQAGIFEPTPKFR